MKKFYETPKLVVHGKVEEITKQIVKKIGISDNLVVIVDSDITLKSTGS